MSTLYGVPLFLFLQLSLSLFGIYFLKISEYGGSCRRRVKPVKNKKNQKVRSRARFRVMQRHARPRTRDLERETFVSSKAPLDWLSSETKPLAAHGWSVGAGLRKHNQRRAVISYRRCRRSAAVGPLQRFSPFQNLKTLAVPVREETI